MRRASMIALEWRLCIEPTPPAWSSRSRITAAWTRQSSRAAESGGDQTVQRRAVGGMIAAEDSSRGRPAPGRRVVDHTGSAQVNREFERTDPPRSPRSSSTSVTIASPISRSSPPRIVTRMVVQMTTGRALQAALEHTPVSPRNCLTPDPCGRGRPPSRTPRSIRKLHAFGGKDHRKRRTPRRSPACLTKRTSKRQLWT